MSYDACAQGCFATLSLLYCAVHHIFDNCNRYRFTDPKSYEQLQNVVRCMCEKTFAKKVCLLCWHRLYTPYFCYPIMLKIVLAKTLLIMKNIASIKITMNRA